MEMNEPVTYIDVPFINKNAVASGPIVRTVDAKGHITAPMRFSEIGDLVMLRPDASFNPTRDRFWFGVLTWVQPRAEVPLKKARLCEIWWVYTKRHLMNLCRNGEVLGASELRASLRDLPNNAAWLSDHYTDEPVDAIITIPMYGEVIKHIKLSRTHTLHADVETGVYEFVEP